MASGKDKNPGTEHTGEDGAPSAVVGEVESARDRLRAAGRQAIGVTGVAAVGSLRQTLAGTGVGMYPAMALGGLVMVDQLQTEILTIMGPEITAALGISRPAFAGTIIMKSLVLAVGMLPMAALVQRRPRRAAVAIMTAYVWAVLTAMTGFVTSIWGLLSVVAITGFATASVRTVHQPLLVDAYPPASRVRVLSFYRGADSGGNVMGALLIGLMTVVIGLTWRGVFLASALVCLAAALFASRLRDPGFGRWDTDKIRGIVRKDVGIEEADGGEVSLGFFEIAHRLLLIPTIRRILIAYTVFGMFLAPFATYMSFFLQERWGLGPGGRSLFSAGMSIISLVALALFSRRGERLFRRDPAKLVRFAGASISVGLSSLALAIFSPIFALTVLLAGGLYSMISILVVSMNMSIFSIIPSRMRPHMAALSSLAAFGAGGAAGLVLLGGVERRYGIAIAIFSLAIPGILAGLALRTAAKTINADLDRMVDAIVEAEEVRGLAAKGVRLPMLSCSNIDFSYGQLQVLFGVNFTVAEGEMVTLLGTNGAGKSTLLRVVSGLGLPTRGSVRLQGGDITYVDAERRVRMGISQIPGGRAVFGPMTVLENLRVQAYAHGRNRRAVEQSIDEAFETFPRLAERRDQLASTLSGGEQQMLGLAAAFQIKPRLLLIDELSLGLAPLIVGELLEMVRRINAAGTAVVLVEQSVNIALSLTEHAYFMEKGEIRFDGRSSDLMARPDLLRSVFLEGATKGQVAPSSD